MKLLLNSKILLSDWYISSTGNDNTTFLDKHIPRVYIKAFNNIFEFNNNFKEVVVLSLYVSVFATLI